MRRGFRLKSRTQLKHRLDVKMNRQPYNYAVVVECPHATTGYVGGTVCPFACRTRDRNCPYLNAASLARHEEFVRVQQAGREPTILAVANDLYCAWSELRRTQQDLQRGGGGMMRGFIPASVHCPDCRGTKVGCPWVAVSPEEKQVIDVLLSTMHPTIWPPRAPPVIPSAELAPVFPPTQPPVILDPQRLMVPPVHLVPPVPPAQPEVPEPPVDQVPPAAPPAAPPAPPAMGTARPKVSWRKMLST